MSRSTGSSVIYIALGERVVTNSETDLNRIWTQCNVYRTVARFSNNAAFGRITTENNDLITAVK